MNKLQSIISINPQDYISHHHLSFQQVKAINSIISCQTSNMGSHKLVCECGHEKVVHNSCYNRHCPICGDFKKEVWVQKQQESLIPSHYFHLVFTLPKELRALAYYNQQVIYDLLYKAASATILDLSKSHYNVTPGFTMILHTWTQTLMLHPHLHCILSGGGLTLDQSRFKSFKKKFFLHVKILSSVFKGKFLEQIKKLYNDNNFALPKDLEPLKNASEFQMFLNNLYSKDWVVYSKRDFNDGQHVIKYLARYTHKIAIYANRIISYTNDTVTFSYHDRSNNNKKKEMTLSREEFIRRFLLHVLPHRFTKIRHYGFLTNRYRHLKVKLIKRLIARQTGIILPLIKVMDKQELLLKMIGKERLCCPKCGGYYTYNHEVCLN